MANQAATPRPRKESYIGHLRTASDDAVLVSLADKLDNARAIRRDLRAYGDGAGRRPERTICRRI